MSSLITHGELRRLLRYEPATGVFVWLIDKGRAKTGDVAGTRWQGKRAAQPYIYIKIGQRRYAAHRLAWFYVTGTWPVRDIDHENNRGLDNRWANLRLATPTQNQANKGRQRNNTTGFKGVTRTRDGKFAAQMHIGGVNHWLGRYSTPEEAHAVYMAAQRATHGDFARAA